MKRKLVMIALALFCILTISPLQAMTNRFPTIAQSMSVNAWFWLVMAMVYKVEGVMTLYIYLLLRKRAKPG